MKPWISGMAGEAGSFLKVNPNLSQEQFDDPGIGSMLRWCSRRCVLWAFCASTCRTRNLHWTRSSSEARFSRQAGSASMAASRNSGSTASMIWSAACKPRLGPGQGERFPIDGPDRFVFDGDDGAGGVRLRHAGPTDAAGRGIDAGNLEALIDAQGYGDFNVPRVMETAPASAGEPRDCNLALIQERRWRPEMEYSIRTMQWHTFDWRHDGSRPG